MLGCIIIFYDDKLAHKDVKSNQGQLSTLAANTLAVLPMFADGNSDAEDMWSDSEFADGDDEGFD